MNWQTVTTEPNELGESPFWHPLERRLYWVDIPARMILRSDADGGGTQRWAMPSEPGCIAPAARGGLVIALRDGIYRGNDWGGALRQLHRFAHDIATTRCNDGKADPLGRFWAGTMFEPRTAALAELYALDARDGSAVEVRRMAGDAIIANGLGWSPDQRTLYWADTPNHIIRAWEWDAQGNVMQHPRVFQRFAPKPADWQPGTPGYGGRPDGAAVDAQGNYWAAMFEGARLLKFAPTGALLDEIPVPAQCPTMPCFGGDDLRTLYVTTARHNRSQAELERMPLSGCVFSMRVDVPGLPVNFFRD